MMPSKPLAALKRNLRELKLEDNSLVVTSFEAKYLRGQFPQYFVMSVDPPDPHLRALEAEDDDEKATIKVEEEFDEAQPTSDVQEELAPAQDEVGAEEWAEYFDNDAGVSYWCNSQTGETSWVNPTG